MLKYFLIICFLCLGVRVYCQEQEPKRNSISLFGGAEYGVDLRSVPSSSVNFRDGFFHSAGFFYAHDFNSKWYLQPGIFYTQVLLSNASRTSLSTTQKVHRLGLSLYAGYYIYYSKRLSIGVGGGAVLLYNLAAVKWNGAFNESTVVHLTTDDIYSLGLEVNVHMLFKYRFHQRWEFNASPFVQMNALPIFKNGTDNTLRTGINLGVGYLF